MIVGNVGRKDHSHPIYTYINSNLQIDDTSNQIIQGPGLANDMRSITYESST